MKSLQAVVLAAGSSRRFPGNKLIQPLSAQRCLLDISYSIASLLTPEVLLVISDDAALLSHCHARHYPFIVNSQSHRGMASSIVAAVSATPAADGWAIFLADMPCIKPATLALLADTWSAHEITVPVWQQQSGHPVIFSRQWSDALLALQGDRGARSLLQNNPAVFRLETDDAGVCFDIDTEADWVSYREQGCD